MTNAVAQITNSISPINGLDVVNAVNGFYLSAFQHTIWLLGIMVGLLGIVVPAIYYFLQNRQLALKEKALTDHLKLEMEKRVIALNQANAETLAAEKTALEEKFRLLKIELETDLSKTKAAIFLLQANSQNEKGQSSPALLSYLSAMNFYIKADNLKQTQKVLKVILSVLPKLKKNDFNDSEITETVNNSIESLAKIKVNGLLDEDLKQFKQAFVVAQKRE